MKKWKRGLKRVAAMALAVLVVGNAIDANTLMVAATEMDVVENAVASVTAGEVTVDYDDFTEALAAWSDGTTLTLLSDVMATGTVELSGKAVMLDLNGYTYSGNWRLFTVREGAALTITDNSEDADGVLECTAMGDYAIANEGTLIIAGGTLTSSVEYYPTIWNFGLLNITGGKVENTIGYAIDHQRGTVNITGGTISGAMWGIVNCDTLIVSGEPNMSSEPDFLWTEGTIDLSGANNAEGWTIKNDMYDNAVVGTNLILPEGLELQVDDNKVDELVSGVTATVSHLHTGGTATCTEKANCDICEKPYGKLLPHDFDSDGKCIVCEAEATIPVTAGAAKGFASDADSLNAVFTEFLEEGETDITVNLPADAEAKLFTAIRRALIDTGVPDRSINLTLAGVTAIPDHDEESPATAIFGEILGEGVENVTQLKSVSLPDALSVGDSAFDSCRLTTLNAPKLQTVGERAFAFSDFTTVELPEVTTLEYYAFGACSALTSIKLPKVTELGQQALDLSGLMGEVTVYLTAEGEIAIDEDCFYILEYIGELSTQVNLVLNCDKKEAVTANDDGTATWKDFTFKSITYWHGIGGDYKSNGDGTHSQTYTCGETLTENCTHDICCVDDTAIVDRCELCEAELGRATINAAGGTYNGTAYEAGVESNGSFADVIWMIKYKKGDTTLETAPTDAGTYIASITCGDITASVEFTIKQETPDIGTVSAESLEDTLDAEAVVLKRTDENIAGTLALTDSELQYGTHTYNWKFTPADTINYETITGTVQITVNDTKAPTITYRVGTENLKQFENSIAPGAFYKDNATVEIEYSDAVSGIVAKQYYMSNEVLSDTTDIEWKEYTGVISLDAANTYFIYVRAVDNAENEVILNSEGIVVYAESAISDDTIEYTYQQNLDFDVQITLNGNTLKEIRDTEGNALENTAYSVDEAGKLTLAATYLDTLEVGEYTYTIYMNPAGVENDALELAYSISVTVAEGDPLKAFVKRMYTIVLNRPADESGVADWTQMLLDKEADGALMANGFVNSDEFVARGLNDSEYITVLYSAFLNREADEGGIRTWTDAMNNGMTRQDVLNGFINSDEFKGLCEEAGISATFSQEDLVRNFVRRMYTVVLNRPADENGLADWTRMLMNKEADGATITNGFVNSDEFVARGLSNEEYINVMYATFLNRVADEGGIQTWMGAFANGATRQEVMDGFVKSEEFGKICKNAGIIAVFTQEDYVRSFVERMYTVALNRPADVNGVEDWTRALISKEVNGAQMAAGFIDGDEFKARELNDSDFVDVLYRTFFNREADADKSVWTNALAEGWTRREVLKGFANSAEFATLCERYGIIAGTLE